MSKLHKQLVDPTAFVESPAEMVNRVCRELGKGSTEVVVINDEAHGSRSMGPFAAMGVIGLLGCRDLLV